MTYFQLALVLLSMALFSGCSTDRHKPPSVRGDGWGDANEVLREVERNSNISAFEVMPKRFWRDSRYLREAKLALTLNTDLVGPHIEVFVRDGVVYLNGHASSLAQKTLAARIVALGRGSFLIRNQIQILEKN